MNVPQIQPERLSKLFSFAISFSIVVIVTIFAVGVPILCTNAHAHHAGGPLYEVVRPVTKLII